MSDFWRPVTQEVVTGLADWAWLNPPVPLQPKFCSPFADVFFVAEDGAIWCLSPIFGDLVRAWENRATMDAALKSNEAMDQFANHVWAMAAQNRGLQLGEDQSYHFIPPPALGGGFDPANIHVASTAVVLSLAGQLHQQLAARSDG